MHCRKNRKTSTNSREQLGKSENILVDMLLSWRWNMVDESEHWVDGNVHLCEIYLTLSVSFALLCHSTQKTAVNFFSNPLSNEMQNIVHVVRSFQLDAAYRMSSWMQHKSWFSVWFFFVGSSVSCSPVLCSLLLLPLAFCFSLSGFCITLFIFSDFPLPVFCQPPVLLPAFWILDFGFLCLAFGSFYSLTFAGK